MREGAKTCKENVVRIWILSQGECKLHLKKNTLAPLDKYKFLYILSFIVEEKPDFGVRMIQV
jgi:hypothetical protein